MAGLVKGKKISGGQKHMFLAQNYDLIMQYHQKFGDEKTCKEFELSGDTLMNLINHPESYRAPNLPAVVANIGSDKLTPARIKSNMALGDYDFLQDKSKPDSSGGRVKLNFTLDLSQSEAIEMLSIYIKKSHHRG